MPKMQKPSFVLCHRISLSNTNLIHVPLTHTAADLQACSLKRTLFLFFSELTGDALLLVPGITNSYYHAVGKSFLIEASTIKNVNIKREHDLE